MYYQVEKTCLLVDESNHTHSVGNELGKEREERDN